MKSEKKSLYIYSRSLTYHTYFAQPSRVITLALQLQLTQVPSLRRVRFWEVWLLCQTPRFLSPLLLLLPRLFFVFCFNVVGKQRPRGESEFGIYSICYHKDWFGIVITILRNSLIMVPDEIN